MEVPVEPIIQSLSNPAHLWVAVGTLCVAFSAMAYLWRVHFPKALTASLQNGFGKALAVVIENAMLKANRQQTTEQGLAIEKALTISDEKLKAAFTAHELVEEMKLNAVIKEVTSREFTDTQRILSRLDAHEVRMTEMERHLTQLLTGG